MHESNLFVVSSCGTSLFTNGASPEMRTLLTKTANLKEEEFDAEEYEEVSRRIEAVRERLLGGSASAGDGSADVTKARHLSAELNGLAGLYGGDFSGRARDHHMLLHSDTFQGETAAALVRDWLAARGLVCSPVRIEGLNTRRFEEFREGLCTLVKWCSETIPGYRVAGYRVVFNLVGGFKSLQGFLQTLGMLYADSCCYLFESEDELLEIPRLPLDLNAGIRANMKAHFSLLRRFDILGTLPETKCAMLPETLLYHLGGKCELSPWGHLIWNAYKHELYRKELLSPPSALVRFGREFAASVKKLPSDRLYLVNLRIEDLARHLEGSRIGRRQAPLNRLDLKKLEGNPLPPSTHEVDAWSDGDARRLFGHFEEDVFVLDHLGPHL